MRAFVSAFLAASPAPRSLILLLKAPLTRSPFRVFCWLSLCVLLAVVAEMILPVGARLTAIGHVVKGKDGSFTFTPHPQVRIFVCFFCPAR